MSGDSLWRTGEGVVHDPRYPDADGATVIRAGLRAARRFRVTSEVTGEDCTVEVLAEFLTAGWLRSSGLDALGGLGAARGSGTPGGLGAAGSLGASAAMSGPLADRPPGGRG